MISVVLLANDPDLRGLLRESIESDPEMRVVVEAGGHGAFSGESPGGAGAVIVIPVDPSNPDCEKGVEKLLEESTGRTPIVAVSSHGDADCAARLFRMGVKGFVAGSAQTTELPLAIKAVHKGDRFICPLVRDILAAKYIEALEDVSHR